jgi:uncharacterized protein (TIGR02246 family)
MLDAGHIADPRGAPVSETTDADTTEEKVVRDVYQHFMDAWNQGDGEALAAVFTDDGDLVGFDGHHLKGREEIAPWHQQLFDKWLKGSRLVGNVEDVRFVGPDVAVMHAVGGTIMRGKSKPSPGRDSIQTLIVTRRGHEWQVAAFQNTRLRLMGPGRAFVAWTLSDMVWRVFRLNQEVSYSGHGDSESLT